jgi:hypothetical protein
VGGDGVEEKVGVEFTMKCVNVVLRLRVALGRVCARTHRQQHCACPFPHEVSPSRLHGTEVVPRGTRTHVLANAHGDGWTSYTRMAQELDSFASLVAM